MEGVKTVPLTLDYKLIRNVEQISVISTRKFNMMEHVQIVHHTKKDCKMVRKHIH
jgi:hypothetical protein